MSDDQKCTHGNDPAGCVPCADAAREKLAQLAIEVRPDGDAIR
jgi:hypothetical protein